MTATENPTWSFADRKHHARTFRRTHLITMLLAVLVGLAAAVEAPPAQAATGQIVAVASNRCLDVAGESRAETARVNIYDCKGSANQSWTYTAKGELKIYASTHCLDVVEQAKTSPAKVQIYRCNDQFNQRWRINDDGTITGVQSGLCLDIEGQRTANSTGVGLYTCNGQSNQQWKTSVAPADVTPPSTPANPRVSNLTCSTVTFSWNASTDDVGVASYDIFHDGQLVTTVSDAQLSTSVNVVAGVNWRLYVSARDAKGLKSPPSDAVSITPPACQEDTVAPTTPTGLNASAQGTDVTLAWTASTDNVGVRSYVIYRDGSKVGTVTGTATVPPAARFVDNGLAVNTRYGYSVVARDAKPNSSPQSASASVTTGAQCSSVCDVKQVTTDTDIPWGLLTLSDGSVLYGRRDAHNIVRLNPATGAKTTVGTVPDVSGTDGEGGLLGLAIAPTFASDRWLYIMHTSPTDNRIVRIKLTTDLTLDLSTKQVLLSGIKWSKFHNGGRLRFGPDGKLYASTGDAESSQLAQDKTGLNGKILRLNPDGSPPADNPFGNYIWSYGHRNPQGLAFDSQGRLWEQEFGNSQQDETNLIVKGGNYGWPQCEGTIGACGTAGLIAPKRTYPTAEGSCSGIAIVRDVQSVACPRWQRLYREVISGTTLTDVRTYFEGSIFGRLRTIEPAPDGGLWLTTSNFGDKDSTADNSDERILRLGLS